MEEYELTFKAKIWIWDGPSPWYFVTVPEKEFAKLKKAHIYFRLKKK